MILEVSGLHCHYGPVHAVKGMDFAVDQGEAAGALSAAERADGTGDGYAGGAV